MLLWMGVRVDVDPGIPRCRHSGDNSCGVSDDTRHTSAGCGVCARLVVVIVGTLSFLYIGWLGSRVVSVLDSGAEGPGFKSQSRRCRVTVLGKLLTPIVPLFTKQKNW